MQYMSGTMSGDSSLHQRRLHPQPARGNSASTSQARSSQSTREGRHPARACWYCREKEQKYTASATHEPSSPQLSKTRTCVPSASGMTRRPASLPLCPMTAARPQSGARPPVTQGSPGCRHCATLVLKALCSKTERAPCLFHLCSSCSVCVTSPTPPAARGFLGSLGWTCGCALRTELV